MNIIALYHAMSNDWRLQQDWEANQPRIDRALEAVLIARTTREVATAVLLSIKMRFEPAVAGLSHPAASPELIRFAQQQEQGHGGRRLANLLLSNEPAAEVKAAAAHSLRFYQDRSAANELVRSPWSRAGLAALAQADTKTLIPPELRPTYAARKAAGVRELAGLLLEETTWEEKALHERLLDIPGVGLETAAAVGVFGFRMGWPIVESYLWGVLARHGLLSAEESQLSGCARRRRAFEPHWRLLLESKPAEPNEVAATLYLWWDPLESTCRHASLSIL